MTISDGQKTIAAIVGIAVVSIGGYKYFMPRSEAAEAVAAAEQKQAKSVNELRAELYLARIKAINEKPKPAKDELDEKERLLALVKAIEAERIKK